MNIPKECWDRFLSLVDEIKAEANAEQPIITAEEARKLGAGNAEYVDEDNEWRVCSSSCKYRDCHQYRAIQPQPFSLNATVFIPKRKDADTQAQPIVKNEYFQDPAGTIPAIAAQPEPVYTQAQKVAIDALEILNKCIDEGLANFLQLEPVEPRCQYCDDTGEVHGLDGEWRGRCFTCDANKPEPVDLHAADRIKYAKQVAEGTTGFYLWEYEHSLSGGWRFTFGEPLFMDGNQYRCTDISCMVSKDGKPAIRMLRTDAQKLQRELGDTAKWKTPLNLIGAKSGYDFCTDGIYTYRIKATIKLNGVMVTREQAAVERAAKRETHSLMYTSYTTRSTTSCDGILNDISKGEYELRPKLAAKWEGSRDDVIALLKELGLL